MAPVTGVFGYNNIAQYDETAVDNPSKLIGGCTLKIQIRLYLLMN